MQEKLDSTSRRNQFSETGQKRLHCCNSTNFSQESEFQTHSTWMFWPSSRLQKRQKSYNIQELFMLKFQPHCLEFNLSIAFLQRRKRPLFFSKKLSQTETASLYTSQIKPYIFIINVGQSYSLPVFCFFLLSLLGYKKKQTNKQNL